MLVKNKGFSVVEIILLTVFTIIIVASIYSIYITHKYTVRISNQLAKLSLIKTQVSVELNYGNGDVVKQKSENGLHALVNISNKKTQSYSSSNILIKDNGQISLSFDDQYIGKGGIYLTPYVESEKQTEDPYIIWQCLVMSNKYIFQSLMPEDCIFEFKQK